MTGPSPVLLTVTDWAALVVPVNCAPKSMLKGVRVMVPGGSPLPVKLALREPPATLPGSKKVADLDSVPLG